MPTKKAPVRRSNVKRSSVRTKRTAKSGFFSQVKERAFNPIIFILGFIVIGFILIRVFAATTTQPTPPGATNTCGATVSNYSYRVPFADSPWNVPTCNMSLFANDITTAQGFGKLLYNYGAMWNASNCYWQGDCPDGNVYTYMGKKGIAAQKGMFMTQFGLAGADSDYSTPIYHYTASSITDADKKKLVVCSASTCLPSNLDDPGCWDLGNPTCRFPQTPVVWKNDWKASGGNDAEAIIINDDTGEVYGLWQVHPDGGPCLLEKALNLYDSANRLCVAGAGILRDKDGKPGNYYTYNQGAKGERGLGIQNAAMIVTPEEVAAGEIRHALTMEMVSTKFGPECSGLPKTVDSSLLNKNCGYALAPAGQFEWFYAKNIDRSGSCNITSVIADNNTKQTFGQLFSNEKMIPEGMRFKITSTDTEIENWIKSRPDLVADTAKAKTARIFARALRDYGFIPGDTTCNGAGFTTAGANNPDAKTKWANLGIKDSSSQRLLDGLFTENNIVALQPPTNTCLDGTTTQFYCHWLSSKYPASVTQTPTSSTTVIATVTSTIGVTAAPPTPTVTAAPPTATATVTPTTPPSGGGTTSVIPTNVSVSGSLVQNWTVWPPRYDLQINWTQSLVSGGMKEYVVLRDGKQVARTASTKFTDFMDLQYQHVYSVQAIGLNGNKSTPVLYTAKPWCFLWVCGLGS